MSMSFSDCCHITLLSQWHNGQQGSIHHPHSKHEAKVHHLWSCGKCIVCTVALMSISLFVYCIIIYWITFVCQLFLYLCACVVNLGLWSTYTLFSIMLNVGASTSKVFVRHKLRKWRFCDWRGPLRLKFLTAIYLPATWLLNNSLTPYHDLYQILYHVIHMFTVYHDSNIDDDLYIHI